MEKISIKALKNFADRIIYQPADGLTNLSYILELFSRDAEFLTIEEVESQIVEWLDKNCCNEPYTRWTSHGSWISLSWEKVRAKLEGMGF